MRRFAVTALVALVLTPVVATGAVRVDQDEVIFTLHAPDAREVFLVGDFNNWNATVEPMDRVDDHFEIGLFLVAGNYRYKFVVDGKTIVDPDNPGPAQKGSPISLVERSGGLILSAELPGDEAPATRAQFGARYIGRFTADDGGDEHAQRVDGFVTAQLRRMRARAVVASQDSSWTWSPARADAYFDRGLVDVDLGSVSLRGFENDSTWVSRDPMGLVGNAGVFGYDAGYDRHGASGTVSSSKLSLHALVADVTSRYRGPAPSASVAIPAGADTSVYAYAPTPDGSDVIALDGTVDTGNIALGYSYRGERGVNPGTVAAATRRGAGFETTTWATRENRNASSLWLSYDLPRSLRATGAYGWGGAKAQAFAAATDSGATPGGAFPGAGSAVDRTFSLGETDRVVATLATRGNGASLRWDWTRFEFDGVVGVSNADVSRGTLDAHGTHGAWSWSGSLEYTHARYNGTPDALSIDWPERNAWLSLWDDFDAERLAAVTLDTYTVLRACVSRTVAGLNASLDAAAVTEDVARTLAQSSVHGAGEWTIHGPWRAQADVRGSWYEGDGWFGALYLEAGYRRGSIDANLGFGFDPDAFDPVIGDYASTARERELRRALGGGFARSRDAAIAASLRERERVIQETRALKLEIVITLP